MYVVVEVYVGAGYACFSDGVNPDREYEGVRRELLLKLGAVASKLCSALHSVSGNCDGEREHWLYLINK